MTVMELNQQAQDFASRTGHLLIDGEWVEAASGKTFETLNPATEESLGWVAHGAAEDIELAVAAARRCFDDERSDWRRMTPSERGKVIHRIGDLIERHADELAMLETLDNGKPLTVAKAADCRPAADLFPTCRAGRRRSRVTRSDLRRLTSRPGRSSCLIAQGAGGVVGRSSVELPVADGGLEALPGAGGRRDLGAQAAEQTALGCDSVSDAGGRAARRRGQTS